MPSTPTFKRLPRAVREQQMLDAAVQVFSERGYHAASMDEIAERANISKPMVYAYLGSKEELFVACLNREGDRLLATVTAAAVAPALDTRQRLHRGLDAFFGFVGAHRHGWAVLYRQSRGQEPFASELTRVRARMAAAVGALLRHAVRTEAGGIIDEDIEIYSYALVGAAESLADWLADHPDAPPEQLAVRLMAVIWPGAARLLGADPPG